MPGGVNSHHPEYEDRVSEWKLMRDTSSGEVKVKYADQVYLPMPSGFTSHADGGIKAFGTYMKRAQFPEIVEPTIQGLVGIIHRTEAQIELPPGMEAITEKATKDGLSLEAFHQRITAELLTTARYCLLVDADPEGKADTPWLAGYSAESLVNWAEDRTMYVLDESGLKLDGFSWAQKDQFRVLRFADGRYYQELYTDTSSAPAQTIEVRKAGGSTLSEIPFVVVGGTDLSLATEPCPLIGVARAAIAQYQLTADYRWQLFMSGQETLFIINGQAPSTVGAGVVVELNGNESATGVWSTPDAKYVGPVGVGIEAHRQAIADQKDTAAAAGAKMFDTAQGAESGDALKIRFAAQTATLVSIARTSAQGLEKALRYAAEMMGKDPNKVVVKPNLSFIDATLTPEQASALVKVWQGGAISKQTLYENLQRGEIASSERTFEEEQELIEAESEALGMLGRQTDPITGEPILGQTPPGETTTADPNNNVK